MSAGAERFWGRLETLAAFALVIFFLAGVAFGNSLTQVGVQKHIIGRGLFCATAVAK
jgi:hypothetical protein